MHGDTGDSTESPERRDDATADRSRRSRRRLLAAGGGLAATLLAGCSNVLPGDDGEGDDGGDDIEITADGGNASATETPPGPASETHVTGLHYKTGNSTRTFHVTLSPSDSGADWWQVETLGGEKIARKPFDEPNTGGRFTTAKEIEIDDGTDAVVVRGHSVDSGYGGQVMLADLTEGFITLEEQGSEPASFEDYSF